MCVRMIERALIRRSAPFVAILLLTLFASIRSPQALSPMSVTPPHYVATGRSHTCALTAIPTGGVKCWGRNDYGQLGDGTITDRDAPTQVSTLTSGVSSIVAGLGHTCALIAANGGVKCWGSNSTGALGDGTWTTRSAPVSVRDSFGDPLIGATAISAGGDHTCAILSNGSSYCWGYNLNGQLGIGSNSITNVPTLVMGSSSDTSRISGGTFHSCLIQSSSQSIKCFGENSSGQLGNGGGSGSSSNIPVSVFGPARGFEVVAGYLHACGIQTDSKVYCWGDNTDGQIGDGGNGSSPVPKLVVNLGTDVAMITAGGGLGASGHTCAIHGSNGDVSCWGSGLSGQLGNALGTNSNLPVSVNGITNVIDLSAGGQHTCAVDNACNVTCWGLNGTFQIGDGTTTNRLSPVTVMTCQLNFPPPTPTPTATPGLTLTSTPTPIFTATPDACGSETSCIADPSLTSALSPRNPDLVVTVSTVVNLIVTPLKAGLPLEKNLQEKLRKKLAKFFGYPIPNISKALKGLKASYTFIVVRAPQTASLGDISSTASAPTRLRLETRKTRVSSRFAPGTYVAKATLKFRDSKGRIFSYSRPGAGTRFTVP